MKGKSDQGSFPRKKEKQNHDETQLPALLLTLKEEEVLQEAL